MRLIPQRLAVAISVLYLSVGAVLQAGAQATATNAEELGDVSFAVSCSIEAQAKFHRAMALYHAFFRGLYGAALAAERAGGRVRASRHFETFVAIASQSDATRPELIYAKQVLSQR